MRLVIAVCLAATLYLGVAHARAIKWEPDPGIYTNEEQVYFETEAAWAAPRWVAVNITRDEKGDYSFQPIDRFGSSIADERLVEDLTAVGTGGKAGSDIKFPHNRNKNYILRRARPATCWVAIRKDKPKADGKEDWHFSRDVKLHDQGGRARAGGGDSGAQEVVIRMRNVIWPPNKDGTATTNRPSLVLYVHKPDEPDRAESYVWADPGAARIGINLRWMQASCTIDGAEKSSEVNLLTFRG